MLQNKIVALTHSPLEPATMNSLKTRLFSLLGLCGLCAFLIGLFAPQFTAFAAAIEVNTLDDEYESDPTQCALREAIVAANTDAAYGGCPAGSGTDTITFTVNGDFILSNSLPAITAPVTIEGASPLTRIGAASAGGVQPSLLEIQSGVTATINNVQFRYGYSNRGGAIYNRGTLTLNSVTFTDNYGGLEGGALYNASTGNLAVNGSMFEGNEAGNGGAIFNSGTLNVWQSSFETNTASIDGGGAIFSENSTTITGSAFSGNTSPLGGAFYSAFGSSFSIINSTFYNNAAGGDGGALYIYQSSGAVYNSTIVGNQAGSSGGGIRNGNSANTTLYNTIVANNTTGGNCSAAGIFTDGGHNLATDSSCGFSAANGSIVAANAMLGYFSNWGGATNTIYLEEGSPAIDAGDDALVPSGITTDQRGSGYDRIAGGAVDIGAYEEQGAAATFTPTFTTTFTDMPTETFTPTFTPTYTETSTFTPTYTETASATFTATETETPTPTYTASETATHTPTYTETASATFTATETETPTPTYTASETATHTPTYTETATATFTATETETPTPTYTASETATHTPTYTETAGATATFTPTLTSSSTATAVSTDAPTETAVIGATNTATAEAAYTPSASGTYLPPPPEMPFAEMGMAEDSVVRSGIPDALQYAIYGRILYQNGSPTTHFGAALYDIGAIGVEGVQALGILQAVDIFSPVNVTYFEGGAVFCLQGEGTLIWLAARNAPRIAEIIGSYEVEEFPGFTCATLFEPGTLVLVRENPTADSQKIQRSVDVIIATH